MEARDLVGADEGPYEAPQAPPSRVSRVGERIREVVGLGPAASPEDAVAREIEQGLIDLAGEERRQFEETVGDKLQQLLDIVHAEAGGREIRAFLLGAVAASAVWILVFVFLLVAFLLVRAH